ncbi:MAG: SAM-dependent methyltransferase [Hyphomonadaceae bacterium]|nr:SAM-dependent methyltransferase [Hyphomonadaceae bacterium]OUX95915.1 MAG: SAM-dependent methyltransferase [Hyphomonas sp. TMED17]CAI8368996.1 MAG: Ubiquinone/menaquinone biosynthesis C-methyltransferase UbiE [Hyphomonas sp. TMED17]
MGLWDRYVVPPLISCACSSKPIMKQRAKIVPLAQGVVLELGCGSGTNFDLYDPDKVTQLHAVEPSEGMLKRAAQSLEGHAMAGRASLHQVGAEALPFADDSIDTVVITFVLCTIPDWRAALAEVRRVLKPDGRALYSEHGLSPDENIAKWQHRVEPVWKRLVGGCHLTRSTVDMLTEAGFMLDQHQTMYLPNTPRIAGYASWGHAVVL